MWIGLLVSTIAVVACASHFFQTGWRIPKPDRVKIYRALAVRFAAAADAEVERRRIYAQKKKEYTEAAWQVE